MGRDLLMKCGASVLCGPDGVVVRFPNGYEMNCSLHTMQTTSHMMVAVDTSPEADTLWADIYWGLVDFDSNAAFPLLEAYHQWRPWAQLIHPYTPVSDPYHVTLNYDREDDEIYAQAFFDKVNGNQWEVKTEYMYIGQEGVAAVAELTLTQMEWYVMGQTAVPHIALSTHTDHDTKDLGPMCKRLHNTADWTNTQIPNLMYSPSEKAYRVALNSLTTSVKLEHRQIERQYGAEKADHPLAKRMLDDLPDTLWASDPTDVGFCHAVPPIDFELTDYTPIWQYPYNHTPEAEDGLIETIKGLASAGVLEPSQSSWNTPILPVEKKNTGKYRMAHDLRRVNAVVATRTVPVPNP